MELKKVKFGLEAMNAIRTGEKTQMRIVMKPQPVTDGILEDGTQCCMYKDCRWLYGPFDRNECWNDRNELSTIGCHDFPRSRIKDYAPCRLGEVLYAREYDLKFEGLGVYLRVKDVRVERLQDISPLDILSEGIKVPQETEWDCEMSEAVMNQFAFEEAWDKRINAKGLRQYAWESNPWVWVVDFERINRKKEST